MINDSTILATAPAESAGTVDITVSTPSDTSSTGSADKFTFATAPTVTGVSPNTGSMSGGTAVTITGTDFFPTVWVYFGTKLATSVTYNSATSITAVSPAESVGTVDITVQTEVGTSATSSSDQFTFTSTQHLAGPPKTTGHPADLTMKQLQPVIVQAENDLRAAGYNVGSRKRAACGYGGGARAHRRRQHLDRRQCRRLRLVHRPVRGGVFPAHCQAGV